MITQRTQPFKKGIIKHVLQWLSPKPKPEKIPEELQRAIDKCSSVEELTTLLFSMKGMGESALLAFDRRIDELERAA